MFYRCLMMLFSFAVGLLFYYLKIPIPFMLGGIITAATVKFFIRNEMRWPVLWRNFGLVIAGYGIGRDFTQNTLIRMSEQLAGVFGAAFIAIGISVFTAWVTYKFTFANLISCVMGMMPGGLNQMMLMADEDSRADANVVVMQQTIRLFGVLITVPFLVVHVLGATVTSGTLLSVPDNPGLTWMLLFPVAGLGAVIALKYKVPTGALIGPIIATALFSILYNEPLQKVPPLLMNLAQINIGLYMGCMLDKKRLYKTKELVPYALGGTVLIIGGSMTVAEMMSGYYSIPIITAFFAMAPGGVAEMCLAGLSTGADVSLILTYQIVRMFIINLTVPFFINKFFDKNYTG